MIKFQFKLRAGNDYSHQRGIKRFPLASEGREADCMIEKVAKVRKQIMSSQVREAESISHQPSLTSKSGKSTGRSPSLQKWNDQDLILQDINQVHIKG